MRVIENYNARNFIKTIVPSEIRAMKPVIAGGFIVALYNAFIRHSDEGYDQELEKKLENAISWQEGLFLKSFHLHSQFDDIDFWFLKDNPIWSIPDEKNHLIREYRCKSDSPIALKPTLFGESEPPMVNRDLISLGLNSRVSSSTYWANSFITEQNPYVLGLPSFKLQFIKKKYQNIEELFSKFDMVNCCAAYHDGKFYFHDDFEESFNQRMIFTNPSFYKKSRANRAWTLCRALKYAKRNLLEFPKEIILEYIEAVADLDKTLTKIRNGELGIYDSIDLAEKEEFENPYGKDYRLSVSKLRDMAFVLIKHLPSLFMMSNFKPNYALFLTSCKEPEIISAVKGLSSNLLRKEKRLKMLNQDISEK